MNRLAPLALAAALLATPTFAQPAPDYEAVEGGIDRTTTTEDIGFRNDASDRMTVPVRLSGTGPFRFLVDTGANRTVVARSVADRLALSDGPQVQLHSVTGVRPTGTARVPTLDLGTRRLTGLEAAVLEGQDVGADGILGTDSLRSQRVVFDFRANLLSITPATVRYRDEPGTIVVRARAREGRLIVTEAYINDRRVTVVVDTGSDVTIGNAALQRDLAKRGSLKIEGPLELLSVTGQKISGEYAKVRKLEFGGVELTDLAVVFADAHSFRQLGLTDKPAILLGMNAVRAFEVVAIDFSARKLRLVLPKGSAVEPVTRMAMR